MSSEFLETIQQRIRSIDAPLLLPISPSIFLAREEDTPEEIVMHTHQAFEEVNDIIAGVLIDTAAFFRFGSLGLAALEAIFDIAKEYNLPIIIDAFIGSSLSSIQVLLDTYSSSGAFPATAIRLACFDNEISLQITTQSTIPVFLPEGLSSSFVYSSGANSSLRDEYPEAFLLIDGPAVRQFRNAVGGGVLHVASGIERLLWKQTKEGELRMAMIDCAKDFLSIKQ